MCGSNVRGHISSPPCCYLLPTNMGGTYHFCVSFQRKDVHIACVFIWQTTFHFKLLEGSDWGNRGACLALIAPHKKLNRCCCEAGAWGMGRSPLKAEKSTKRSTRPKPDRATNNPNWMGEMLEPWLVGGWSGWSECEYEY